jgi:ABC-type nitrate/sulfonate/bicarbonate transport system substrate-binding protein
MTAVKRLFKGPASGMSRRAVLAMAAVLTGGFMLASQATAAEELRVGVQQVSPDEVYLAQDWAKPYELDVNITQFSSGGDMLKAFLAGRVDVANGGSARLVTLAAQQPDTFYIVGTQQSGGDRYGVVVKSDSEVADINQLKGKKIGAVKGSGTYGTFLIYLKNHGLSENDFQVVNMKINDLPSAVQQGLVEAAVMWEPFVAIAEDQGSVKRIISLKDASPSPNFLLASKSFTDKNPDAIVKFLASEIDAGNLITKDPAKAGEIAASQIGKRGVKVSPKALEVAFTRISVDRAVTDDLIEDLTPVAQALKDAGKIDEIPDFKSFVRRDLYEKAVALSKEKGN